MNQRQVLDQEWRRIEETKSELMRMMQDLRGATMQSNWGPAQQTQGTVMQPFAQPIGQHIGNGVGYIDKNEMRRDKDRKRREERDA